MIYIASRKKYALENLYMLYNTFWRTKFWKNLISIFLALYRASETMKGRIKKNQKRQKIVNKYTEK